MHNQGEIIITLSQYFVATGRTFPHLFRPALGPTQPPVQLVQGHSRG